VTILAGLQRRRVIRLPGLFLVRTQPARRHPIGLQTATCCDRIASCCAHEKKTESTVVMIQIRNVPEM